MTLAHATDLASLDGAGIARRTVAGVLGCDLSALRHVAALDNPLGPVLGARLHAMAFEATGVTALLRLVTPPARAAVLNRCVTDEVIRIIERTGAASVGFRGQTTPELVEAMHAFREAEAACAQGAEECAEELRRRAERQRPPVRRATSRAPRTLSPAG